MGTGYPDDGTAQTRRRLAQEAAVQGRQATGDGATIEEQVPDGITSVIIDYGGVRLGRFASDPDGYFRVTAPGRDELERMRVEQEAAREQRVREIRERRARMNERHRSLVERCVDPTLRAVAEHHAPDGHMECAGCGSMCCGTEWPCSTVELIEERSSAG